MERLIAFLFDFMKSTYSKEKLNYGKLTLMLPFVFELST